LAFTSEQSLGNFFSLRTTISTAYNYFKSSSFGGFNRFAGLGIAVRKYLGIRKRKLGGRDQNKFTGNYVGFALGSLLSIYGANATFDPSIGIENIDESRGEISFDPSLADGWQERIGEKFIVNSRFSVGYNSSINKVGYSIFSSIGLLIKK